MIRYLNIFKGLPWIAAIAFFMQSLDATILNTALPSIAINFERSPLAMQSAIISYTLTVAMIIPISGWLADHFGTRKIFILSVIFFVLGSIICAASNTLTLLIIARIIQGIGGAIMMPVARLTLLKAYPRNQLLSLFNFVTIPGLVGPILGPILGGLIVTYATWHWIFLINIPIGILGIYYATKYMPNFINAKRKFDLIGFMFFSFGLVYISLGIELFSEHIINFWISLIIFFIGFCLLICYIFHARNCTSPLISLPLFKIRTFSVGILGNIASRLGTSGAPFMIPLMLQVGFQYSAMFAGCMMAPTAIGSLVAKSIVTKILRTFGYRRTLIGITIIIGILIASFILEESITINIYRSLIILFILGIATSIQFTGMNTITLADLSNENASDGNSVLAIAQQLTISFGVAVSAAIFSFYQTFEGNNIQYFQYTFLTMGIVTMFSSIIFMMLRVDDGYNLIK